MRIIAYFNSLISDYKFKLSPPFMVKFNNFNTFALDVQEV